MEQKTKITAEDGQHDFLITREFDLPVKLVFKAHTDPEIFEQWMSHEYGTVKVERMEMKNHGSWRFINKDLKGNIVFGANGVIHEIVPGQRIIRTFEMENTPFPVQLDFIEFEKLTDDTSKLTIHTIFRTVAHRDQILALPFS